MKLIIKKHGNSATSEVKSYMRNEIKEVSNKNETVVSFMGK